MHPHTSPSNGKKSLPRVYRSEASASASPRLQSILPQRYAIYLLNTMLGGGMSSRLFQTIREDRGLAYSIYSETNPFRDTGCLAIYAGTSLEKTPEVLRLTLDELCRLKADPVPDAELKRAKDQLKSNIVLGLESTLQPHVQPWRVRRCTLAASSRSTRSSAKSKP